MQISVVDAGGLGAPGSSGNGGGSTGAGYSYSVNGYCDTPYRDGKYIRVVVHGSASSTYSGTLYINGTAVGHSWASAAGGGTSGTRTLSWESPGPFESRSVTIRFKGQDRQGGSQVNAYAYPTTGSFPTAMSITLTLDPNGGTVDTPTGYVVYGDTYGEMPVPTKRGSKFSGWFTEAEGGTLITENTEVTVTENQTLYAHWDVGFSDAYVVDDGTVKSIMEAYIVADGVVSQVAEAYLVTDGVPHEL